MSCRLLFCLLALCTLNACDTLSMLHSAEPIRTGTFKAEWRTFAECVQFRLGDDAFFDPQLKRAQVRDQNGSGKVFAARNSYEIAINQTADSTVSVELRQRWIADDNAARTKHYWAAVEACAA